MDAKEQKKYTTRLSEIEEGVTAFTEATLEKIKDLEVEVKRLNIRDRGFWGRMNWLFTGR